jgi:hypothetical protein
MIITPKVLIRGSKDMTKCAVKQAGRQFLAKKCIDFQLLIKGARGSIVV